GCAHARVVVVSIAAIGHGIPMKRTDENSPRDPPRNAPRDAWRALVNVAQIPDTGLHREIKADARTRAAMAEIAGLRDISSAYAAFDLSHRSSGRVHVGGRVRARVGQTCVVTLEPIENEIDEEVELIFAPAEEIAPQTDDDESAMVEPPEPIE